MIQIRQLKLHIGHTEADLRKKICHTLRIREDALLSYTLRKKSLDARKKPELFYIYTVDVRAENERAILKKNRSGSITVSDEKPYRYPKTGSLSMSGPPVVIGSGPAGMFCALFLAELGYCPILLERGAPVDQRREDVETFWREGVLKPDSNVQFGEGGAGTFSDGKLNTLVKDPMGRNRKVLEIFVEHGAPEEILYMNKPHIGTDVLMGVVKNMRQKIESYGGQVFFYSQVTDLSASGQRLSSLTVRNTRTGERKVLKTQTAVLAVGHSARDTFEMLSRRGIDMRAKDFAVGLRIEHDQRMIDRTQYGRDRGQDLPAASYKLSAGLENGRSVYTFCMCPGGYVVNASSEEGCLAVNGMSYHDRSGKNANSAVIVTVRREDYPGEGPLAGVEFQRELERRAYRAGKGRVPVQMFEDYRQGRVSGEPGGIRPQIKGRFQFANLREIFPDEIGESIRLGIEAFDRKIPGFAAGDAMLSGVESRTSSPVRILRDENLQSSLSGLYPCGEGAGYAGGITSAAMDGIKVAEEIVKRYRPFDRGKKD